MCRVVYGWVIEQRLITTDLSHLLLFVYFLTRCPIGVEIDVPPLYENPKLSVETF